MRKSVYRQIGLFLLGIAVLWPRPVLADQNAQVFLDTVKRYDAGEYSEAAEMFEKLAGDGIQNGKLYYNIANAHLKADRLGSAILWYERALRLIPADPDVRFNLEYARSLVKDEPAALGSPVLQVLFFWKDLLGVSAWQWLGISAGAVFWCLWAIVCFFKKPFLKPLVYGVLAVTLISAGTALYLNYSPVFHPRAIILKKAVSVRSGFSENTTELFILHEGTLVAVEKRSEGFIKIRYAEDKIGWVPDTMAEII
jgi:tetratricopeptide (TPR) repeat protein